jgi:hypothetical protein
MSGGLYEKLYETEWQRREHLQAALSIPLGILVLLGSGLLVLVRQFDTRDAVLKLVFWPTFVLACAAFATATYMVVRSFYGYVYSRIPLPSELYRHHEALKAHYEALGKPSLADQEFELYLMRRYINAGDRNSVHNANRGEYLHKANRSIVLALSATALCAVPYAIAVRATRSEPQRVEIVRFPEQQHADDRQLQAEGGAAHPGSASQH